MLWIPHQFSWEVTCRVDVSMLNLSIYPFLANCFFIVLAMLLLAWASIYVVPLWLVFAMMLFALRDLFQLAMIDLNSKKSTNPGDCTF